AVVVDDRERRQEFILGTGLLYPERIEVVPRHRRAGGHVVAVTGVLGADPAYAEVAAQDVGGVIGLDVGGRGLLIVLPGVLGIERGIVAPGTRAGIIQRGAVQDPVFDVA